MAIISAVGSAQELDGREAGLQAAHQALNRFRANTPALAFVISSHQYQAREVLNGVSSLLGDTPLVGFSSPAGLTSEGLHPHSVVVAILGGDVQADTLWLPMYAQSAREAAAKFAQHASARVERQTVFFFADGFNGDAEQFCEALPQDKQIIGALASGDLNTGNSYQLVSAQTGTGGLAAAFLRGKTLQVGVGADYGWDPVGAQFRITRSRGFWLRTLDGHPASEVYAGLFGQPARNWAFPPLSHLARLYPLGVMDEKSEMTIRAPIRVEADGSFRMNAPVRDGADAFLLVGSGASCINAAKSAAQQALLQLGNAVPRFALVLADISWQMLLKAQPGAEISAVQEILGANVPIAGGYTLGQAVSKTTESKPKFLNQNIVVAVFGESK
ncbi:MAG: FIST C-terminal domain-containing protein [Anaerolineales bacterium]|nr:FIST C-terminal domain-containing protein [Anaerolineales bacterium]